VILKLHNYSFFMGLRNKVFVVFYICRFLKQTFTDNFRQKFMDAGKQVKRLLIALW